MVNKEQIYKFMDAVINFINNEGNPSLVAKCFRKYIKDCPKCATKFLSYLEETKECLANDLDFYMDSDPASDSKEEVVLAYPGYKAILYYRVAHKLYEMDKVIEARIISEKAHSETGIDIHPGAKIGCPFFIDHGTGIVIGETTEIGNFVKIYQGVTLGALSLAKGSLLKGTKRHPTVGNNVTIYSGASILGGDVVIGDNSVIGSNVFIVESIPENSRVSLSKPELVITKK